MERVDTIDKALLKHLRRLCLIQKKDKNYSKASCLGFNNMCAVGTVMLERTRVLPSPLSLFSSLTETSTSRKFLVLEKLSTPLTIGNKLVSLKLCGRPRSLSNKKKREKGFGQARER